MQTELDRPEGAPSERAPVESEVVDDSSDGRGWPDGGGEGSLEWEVPGGSSG